MNDRHHSTLPSLKVPEARLKVRPAPLGVLLERVENALAETLGRDAPLLYRLRSLQGRLKQGRLQLAVLGQFKRGKSTFINALLGSPVLPTGVVPLTAIPTFIAWGESPRVVVHFKGTTRCEQLSASTADAIRDILFRFVAEEANAKNRRGVARVELFYPAELLAEGIVVIDTPGVGSTWRHNTEAALQVLPECDAAFFVVSADPPITEVELELLNELKVKTPRIFYILNKIDYLRPQERNTVVKFLRDVLTDASLTEVDTRIFPVSARDGLDAKLADDNRALNESGIGILEDHLMGTLTRDKLGWLEEAVKSRVLDILAQAAAELELRMRALRMTVEELSDKSNAFRDALRSTEVQRRITRDLLTGEHRRLRQELDSQIDRLRAEITAAVTHTVDAESALNITTKSWEGTVFRRVSDTLQREFDKARVSMVETFTASTAASLLGCQDSIATIAARIRQIAANIFDVSLAPDAAYEPFELGEDPYWVTEGLSTTLIPDPGRLLDRLLPLKISRTRLRARMIGQAQELITRNAENLRWAIIRGLDETFRKAVALFEERLDCTITATNNVIQDVVARRQDRAFMVGPELQRSEAGLASLVSLRKMLQANNRLDLTEAKLSE